MDLVYEQQITGLKLDENGSQISRSFDCRSGSNADVLPHFRGNDSGEACFTKAGRSVQKHMIKRVMPSESGIDIDRQAFLYFLLSVVFPK